MIGAKRAARFLVLLVVLFVLGSCHPKPSLVPTARPQTAVEPATPDDRGEAGNIRIRWESLDGPPGGAIWVVKQSPYPPHALYAGTIRGLYRSIDRAESWHLVQGPTFREVTSIAFAKNRAFFCASGSVHMYEEETGAIRQIHHPCTRVESAGDKLYVVWSVEGIPDAVPRVLWSDASGDEFNWTDISPSMDDLRSLVVSASLPDRETPPFFLDISHVVSVGEKVYANVVVQAFAKAYLNSGLYVTSDGGETWQTVTVGLDAGLNVQHVDQDPQDPRHILVAARFKVPTEGRLYPLSELMRESYDGGETWAPVTDVQHLPGNQISDLALVGAVYYAVMGIDWVVRLDGPGHDEVEVLGMPRVEGYTDYFGLDTLFFDCQDPQIVYGHNGGEGIIRSDDGMQTWKKADKGIVAAQFGNLTLHPENVDVFVTSGNLGHLAHITRDGGQSWEPMVGSAGFGDEVAFDPHDPDRLLLVTELTALLESNDIGRTWHRVAPNFWATRIYDLAVTADGKTLYVSNLGTGISRLEDVGRLPELRATNELDHSWEYLFKSPDYAYVLETDPQDRDILYASYSPKKFEDHASVWKYVRTQMEQGGWSEVLRVANSNSISSVKVAPSDPRHVYAGTTGTQGQIYASHDRGQTWETLNDTLTFATIHAMAIDPHDEQIVYAAPWGGGVFKTTDGGETWDKLSAPTISVAAIVVDPADSQHLWIGDRTRPAIYFSSDGGQTWETQVHLDEGKHYRVGAMALHQGVLYFSTFDRMNGLVALFGGGPMSGTVFRLDREPTTLRGDIRRAVLGFASDGKDLLAITHVNGVFRLKGNRWHSIARGLPDMGFNGVSVAGGNLYLAGGCDLDLQGRRRVGDDATVNQVYVSGDRGRWWSPLLQENPFGSGVKAVLVRKVRTQIDTLFAATGNGLYVSPDGGSTWTEENDGLAFRNIGSMVVGENLVYAGTLGGGVYVGRIGPDGAVSWSPSNGPYPKIHNIQIRVDPTDANTIYASAYPGGVFKTTDGGQTWVESNFALPTFQVADPTLQGYYSLEIDPGSPNVIYLGIFGKGVFKSTDGAATWMPVYGQVGQNREIMTKGITRILPDPYRSNTVYLATDEGVYVSRDGAEHWESMSAGLDTLDVLSLKVAADGTLYAGTNGYGAYVYDSEQQRWQTMGRTTGFGDWDVWERGLYQYAALLFDPQFEDKVYLGHFPGGFFVSEDGGRSWKNSNLRLGNDGLFSLAMHPQDSNVLFAGSYNGVVKSVDGGRTWVDKSEGMPSEQWPFTVAIDGDRPEVMYVTIKNGQNKGFCHRNEFCGVVMKSTDGGESWSRVMNGLDDHSEFYMLIIYPPNHDVLFLSSSKGIYMSLDAGQHWQPINDGLPVTEHRIRDNVAQNLKLTADGKSLILTIVDYGVWRADIDLVALE